jgi:integrase
MPKSTETAPPRTAAEPKRKPLARFPLWQHAGSGQWAKKIKKRTFYFGSWRSDPDGALALERFNREYPYLVKGETPPAVDVSNGCTLKTLVNDFLRSKEEKLKAGDLSPRTFRDYYSTCEGLIEQFGRERLVSDLRPDDFRRFRAKLAARYNVVSLNNEINRVTIVFNYAHDNNLIEKPVGYGQNFDRPSAKALRRSRNEAGPKLFERDEVLRLLGEADVQLKAMILLGVNCGFGNTDVASLPQSAVNLETGWVTFPRPKTEIPRRIPLWPETIAALKEALAIRPAPTDPSGRGLCFLTRLGRPWVRIQEKKPKEKTEGDAQADGEKEPGPEASIPINAISGQFGKLLRALKINGRVGRGFYTFRHCVETHAGECKDQVAVDAIMGHVDSSMAANYRQRISDERLRAAVDTVRAWLFPPATEKREEGGAA